MDSGKLTELLEQTADQARIPDLAEPAWSRAHRVRRRRRALVAVAAAAAVVVGTSTVVTALRPEGPVPVPAGPTPSPTLQPTVPGVDHVPATPDRARPAGLPVDLSVAPPADSATLTQRPLDHAIALVQLHAAEGAIAPLPVYALAADGSWRRIEVVDLTFIRDADGNRADPLRSTALSPDGRHAAIAQPDAIILVDLTSGDVRHIVRPGYHELVLWRDNRTVLVGGDAAVYTVDVATATAEPVNAAVPLWDLAVPPVGERWIQLPPTAAYHRDAARPVLRHLSWALSDPRGELPVDSSGLAPYGVLDWHGPALRRGELVVRAGWGYTPTLSGAEQVAVVDTRTGSVARMLFFGEDRFKGCCQPLAWLDDDDVLVHTDREGLIVWNLRSGEVSQATAGPIDGVVAMGR
jgi:hypothetical protein